MFSIKRPFFFDAVESFARTLRPMHAVPQALIIRLWRVPLMEIAGLQTLEKDVQKLLMRGIPVLLIEASEQVKANLEKRGLLQAIGQNRYYDDFDAALAYCRTLSGGAGHDRLMVIDAYAEPMLITSCDYLRDNTQSDS
jgi:MFS superfamily sulfate permease-like transporter